jgi:hypothetical protein
VLPVRGAEDGEVPEDVRQYHANTVERPEEHPAVSVSIRILRCITQYGKTFTPNQFGTEFMIFVFSMSAVLAAPSLAKTLTLSFIQITSSHATYVSQGRSSSERSKARRVSSSMTMEDINVFSFVEFCGALHRNV